MKVQLKIKPLKLEGLNKIINEKNKVVAVSLKLIVSSDVPSSRNTSLLNPFNYLSSSSSIRHFSRKRNVTNEDYVEWLNNDYDGGGVEFENVIDFHPLDQSRMSIYVLYGESDAKNTKLVVLGKVSIKITELPSIMEIWAVKKIPITLKIAGVDVKAILSVHVSFVEIRNFQPLPDISDRKIYLKRVYSRMASLDVMKQILGSQKKTTDDKIIGSRERYELPTMGTILGIPSSSNTQLKSVEKTQFGKRRLSLNLSHPRLDTLLDPVPNIGFWKKRAMSFRLTGTQVKPLIEQNSSDDGTRMIDNDDRRIHPSFSVGAVISVPIGNVEVLTPGTPDTMLENDRAGSWEVKEILSKDGRTRLKVNVFFASFDQCNEQVGGYSACGVLSTVIAHWLHSNQSATPTKLEFDTLINEGSSEWRSLCNNYSCSPDHYFELETILQANLKPLSVSHQKSFVGYFNPEKFDCLDGKESFDDIWNQIIKLNVEKNEYYKIYIVSWHDHFFVLKIDLDAYYIIDTLGARLYEGCNKAYILKFDESTRMHEKVEQASNNNEDEENGESIMRGKECGGEFIKRFLAAIPVKELEEENKKGSVSTIALHQRLQIEFDYTCSESTC